MISELIYTIVFSVMNQWQLPSFLRKVKQLAWINAFTEPYRLFHESQQAWRASIRYKINHNGQVIYLEKVLNEYYNIPNFDPNNHVITRAIYIGSGNQVFPPYIFTEQEQIPVYVPTDAENSPIYIPTQSELDANYTDFIVWVPASLSYIEEELRALVDYYIDTRIYKIETY